MATVDNDTQNTATPSNDVYSTASRLWSEMTKTWGDYGGTWENPQDLSNDAVNETTIVNDDHND